MPKLLAITDPERWVMSWTSYRPTKPRKSHAKPKTSLTDKDAYTLSEAAELLGVSRQTVTAAITIKRRQTTPLLRTVRIGTAIRVTRHDLDDYIAALRISAGISMI